ncbi:hypothetical protein C2S53_010935 [Perilla frutescens var. hirtella]|uniref:Mitochondrial acidic protein MAM33 n=1 Tax=Perilla frutescens var. hirtella TaxID=608512 RepID=A0AAD4JEY4_PERFH|nr:hypothetical protein C2S53_010935 [Perilla frutescens var. hirtella]
MAKVTNVLRRAHRAIEDLDLLKILESELNQELSSMRFQNEKIGSFGDFALEWDSPESQDVILRKKNSSGEEVAISALLGRDTFEEDSRFPAEALLKICVKKPGLSSILKFDCVASNRGGDQPDFQIQSAHYIPLSSSPNASIYGGPLFSDLDPSLQHELRQYLATRGIKEDFTNNLLLYLHKKEQGQYTGWLQKLKDMMDRT